MISSPTNRPRGYRITSCRPILDSLDRWPLLLFGNNRSYLSFTGIKEKNRAGQTAATAFLDTGWRLVIQPDELLSRAETPGQPFRPFDDAQPARRPR